MPAAPAGSRCCGGKVSARVEDLDTWQEHPFGTTVWKKSYARRPTVEGPYGKLKANAGLGGEACQAFGLPANTMAATSVAVAYNLKLTFGDDQDDDTDTTGDSTGGAQAASDDSDTGPELAPIPPQRSECPDTFSAADADIPAGCASRAPP